MSTKDKVQSEAESVETGAPRKMTFAENAILTIKLLLGCGLLGAALWAINQWKTASP